MHTASVRAAELGSKPGLVDAVTRAETPAGLRTARSAQHPPPSCRCCFGFAPEHDARAVPVRRMCFASEAHGPPTRWTAGSQCQSCTPAGDALARYSCWDPFNHATPGSSVPCLQDERATFGECVKPRSRKARARREREASAALHVEIRGYGCRVGRSTRRPPGAVQPRVKIDVEDGRAEKISAGGARATERTHDGPERDSAAMAPPRRAVQRRWLRVLEENAGKKGWPANGRIRRRSGVTSRAPTRAPSR
jgi:hypothetical protein